MWAAGGACRLAVFRRWASGSAIEIFTIMETISTQQFNQAGAEDFARILAGPAHEALPWLATAAEHGVAEAQFHYGQWLLQGKGAPRDPEQAVPWLRKAADTGHVHAMNLLGRCYENAWGIEHDMMLATYWFRRAAERGLDWGMYNYATSLALGRGLKTDRAQALQWFRRAADAGHIKSLNMLGGFYEDGWEVEAAEAAAFDYYRRAAEGGDFRGQFNYARLLAARGHVDLAAQWMRRVPETATPAFWAQACEFLAGMPQPELRDLAATLPRHLD